MHNHHHHPGMHQHPGNSPRPTAGEGCGCHQRPHHPGQAAGPVLYGDHDRAPRGERCTCGCHRGPQNGLRPVSSDHPHHLRFRRRLFTREEKIARLLRYLDALYAEAEAVEERLTSLGLDLEALDEEELDDEDLDDVALETLGDETEPEDES